MRRRQPALALAILALAFGFGASQAYAVRAQRHNGRSSPPTAPQPVAAVPVVQLTPASSGLGAIQYVQVSYGVPAPQALTRQLRFDDDRTRAAALSAIGAPGQYLQHGHIPLPKSVDLELAALGNNDDVDALLTVELDQHIVTAVLIPVDGNWRRVATLIFPTPFNDASTTPSTWVRIARSLVQPEHYRAIFHASTGSMKSNFSESEAHVRVINGHALVVLSFESTVRECTVAAPIPPKPAAHPDNKGGCNVLHRWFEADASDPTHRFELVTGSGHISVQELTEPMADSRTLLMSHLRTFSCQPFVFNEQMSHFEPSALNAACKAK